LEHKALKVLETTRRYMYEFDAANNTIAMCSKVENELYRLKSQEKKELRGWVIEEIA
jgi:hypothetical protein